MSPRTLSLLLALNLTLPLSVGTAQEGSPSGSPSAAPGALEGNLAATPSLAPKDRLKQLQQTFDANLAQIHRPLLMEHLKALMALNETVESNGTMTEIALIRLEISETQAKLQANQGIPFEYKDPKLSSLSTSQVQSLPVVAKMVFQASQAEGAASGSPTVTLGRTQWQVQNLPAGNYQLNLVHQPLSTASPLQVRWTALGQSGVATLNGISDVANANETQGIELGLLKVTGRTSVSFPLTLENLSMFGPPLHVRHLVLSVAPEKVK